MLKKNVVLADCREDEIRELVDSISAKTRD